MTRYDLIVGHIYMAIRERDDGARQYVFCGHDACPGQKFKKVLNDQDGYSTSMRCLKCKRVVSLRGSDYFEECDRALDRLRRMME